MDIADGKIKWFEFYLGTRNVRKSNGKG